LARLQNSEATLTVASPDTASNNGQAGGADPPRTVNPRDLAELVHTPNAPAASPYTIAALSFAALSLCVSVLAFVVALMNYRRKAGQYVRGSFSTTSSVACNDMYLSSLVIENLKDRAITVFAIYLRAGTNYYIEVENFETSPMVLGAFQTYRKEYGPIEFYSVNLKRISLRPLLGARKTKLRLVLSTGDGKYVVPLEIRRWTPTITFLRNHLTAVIRPVRSTYKGQHIGGNVRFVIDFQNEDGRDEIVPIHPRDFEVKIFRDFQLSQEALETKETLEAFLQRQAESGKLVCKKWTVIDMQAWRDRQHSDYSETYVEAPVYGPLQYYVIGRLSTMYLNWKQRRENASRARSQ